MIKPQRQGGGEVARLRVDEVGDALLVSVNGVHPATAAVTRGLPTETGRICVVMTDPALAYHPDLGYRLCRWVPARYEAVRLISPCAGMADQSGRIPAQHLCELIEADVVAPVGELVAVPGGTMYALTGGADGAEGQWLRYRPGRPPLGAGRRFPLPEWERDLADAADPGIPEITVEQIPAGLWVHRSHSPAGPVEPTDLAFAVPIQPDTVTLLVSRPGDPPLAAADLRRTIEAIPAALRERLVVTPYGDNPVADGALGATASAAANRTLRVRTGLALHLSGRGAQVTAVGMDGTPTWIPFAREIAWRPHGGGRILSWTAPTDQLLPAGPAQFMLNERWLVEVLEAGLWIREVNRTEGAAVIRRLPLEAEHCTVVIGVGDEDQAAPPWRAVDRLLHRLPGEALARLRLAVPAEAGQWFAEDMAKGLRRILRGVAPLVLSPAGRLLGPTGEEPGRRTSSASSEPTEQLAAPARAGAAGVPGRRKPTSVDEISSLLNYVDQIRQAPAWDELPGEPGPSRSPVATPTRPSHGRAAEGNAQATSPTDGRQAVPRPPAPPVVVPVPQSAPVVVVAASVAVAPSEREAGPAPTARPARRAAVSPVDEDANEEAPE
ncbi:hypothetical protein ABT346_04030 [Micromonospora peucetia]|uniref:hypothetical protein n=1 Tax=Micromonospora peucetia TaxID=47871 RepID=UPI00332ECD66